MVVRIGPRCEEDSMTDCIQIHRWGVGCVRGMVMGGRRWVSGRVMGRRMWMGRRMMMRRRMMMGSRMWMSRGVMSCCVAINLAGFLIARNAFLL